MQQLGQPMIRLRADHEVDERSPLEQGLALGLGHTTGDADQHVHSARAPALAQTPQATELGVYLLRGFLPDVARVQNDEIGVIGALGGDIAMRRQKIRHSGGIIHVHLAAVGLDEQLLGHASAATSPEITCGYGQTGTRSATCHADWLELPHDILMGIRKDRVKRPRRSSEAVEPSPGRRNASRELPRRTGRGEERQALGGAPLWLKWKLRRPKRGSRSGHFALAPAAVRMRAQSHRQGAGWRRIEPSSGWASRAPR